MLLRKKSIYDPILPGRYIPYWKRMVDSLLRQMNLSRDRFLLSEQSATPASVFVRILLDTLDYESISNDPFEAYHQTIVPEAIMMGKKFYPLVKSPRINRFVDKPVRELMLPTLGLIDNINYSPVDNWDRLKSLKPLRLLSMDSMELKFPEDQMYLRYKREKPTFMCFAIDLPALLLMFWKYVQHEGVGFQNIDQDKFIKEHILVHLYEDLANCWLMNFLSAVLNEDDDVLDSLIEFAKVNQYVGMSSMNLAYNDIVDLVDRVGSDKIRLSALLDTEFFIGHDLLDYMNLHETKMVVGTDNRTIGFELLKSSTLLEILVSIIELQPDKTTKIRKQFSLEYGMMLRSNWKSHVMDKELREYAFNIQQMLVLVT